MPIIQLLLCLTDGSKSARYDILHAWYNASAGMSWDTYCEIRGFLINFGCDPEWYL